jgi:hypothetical protein
MGEEETRTGNDIRKSPRLAHALLARSIQKPKLKIADGSIKHITVQQ